MVGCGNDMASFGANFYWGSYYVQNLTDLTCDRNKTECLSWGELLFPSVPNLQILCLSLSLRHSFLSVWIGGVFPQFFFLLPILSLISSTTCSFNLYLFATDSQLFSLVSPTSSNQHN